MPGRQHRHRPLAQHHLGAHLGELLDRRADQADVDDTGADQPQLLDGRPLVQLDLDVRGGGAEALHDPGDDRQQRRADEVDPQPAGLPGVDPPRGLNGAVELCQQLPGVAQERLARRGQLHPPSGAGQQLAAELVLELADLLAQRRLGDVQPGGRAAEVQLLGDGHEVAQLAQLDALAS